MKGPVADNYNFVVDGGNVIVAVVAFVVGKLVYVRFSHGHNQISVYSREEKLAILYPHKLSIREIPLPLIQWQASKVSRQFKENTV